MSRIAIIAIVLGLTAVAVSSVAIRWSTPVTIQSDFGAPSLMVRDCLEERACYYQINPFGDATALGVQHGVVFDDALLLASALGDPRVVYRAAAELFGYGALLLFFLWGLRTFDLDRALLLLGTSLLTWWVLCPSDTTLIWNPALLPLPAFAFAAASASYLLRRRLPDLLVATLSASVAAQIHASAFVAGVALVYLLAGTDREKRGHHALAAALVFWGSLQVGSPAMFTDVFYPQFLEGGGRLALLGAGGSIGLALLLYLGRRFPRGETGLFVLFATTHLPFFLAARWLSPEATRYAFTLVPGVALLLALLCAALLGQLGRRLGGWPPRGLWPARFGASLGLLVLIFSAVPETRTEDHSTPGLPPEAREFTVESARALGEHLRERYLFEFPEVFRHLRGGIRIKQMLNGLAITFPRDLGAAPLEEPVPDLAVLPLSGHPLPEPLPADWALVGDARADGLLVQAYRPLLRWEVFGLLAPEPGGGLPRPWMRVEYAFRPSNHPQDRRRLASRSDPGLSPLLYGTTDSELLLLRVPLRLPAGSPPRLLVLPPGPRYGPTPSECRGAFVALEGLDAPGPLPARRLRLEGGEEDRQGVVTLAWDLTGPNCIWASNGLPPPVLELGTDDLRLLAAVYPDSELGRLEAPKPKPEPELEALAAAARALMDQAEGGAVPPAELEPWPADFNRTKEPLTGLGVKLASIFALWLCFAVGVVRLLRVPAGRA